VEAAQAQREKGLEEDNDQMAKEIEEHIRGQQGCFLVFQ
jgi:hypothetical protein